MVLNQGKVSFLLIFCLFVIVGFYALGCGSVDNQSPIVSNYTFGDDDDEYDWDFSSQYVVVDISGGTGATSYSRTALNAVPADLLTNTDGPGGVNIYKYSKIVLRRISSGVFTMGSPGAEIGRFGNEDEHQVTLSKFYYMGVFEVTQKQYELVMGATPSQYLGDLRPVEKVSWNDIRGGDWPAATRNPNSASFMGVLRSKTSLTFDLPTEAQWEYACRAGTTKAFNNDTDSTIAGAGNEPTLDPLAWYTDNTGGIEHQDVGSKQVNNWGLYDMHGNVYEWCLDWYQAAYGGDATNPEGPVAGSDRVLRGGGWVSVARNCRSAFRNSAFRGFQNRDVGFRAAFSPQKVKQ